MEQKLYLYSNKLHGYMGAIDLRNIVQGYINNADERLLSVLKAVAESYQVDAKEDFTLSEEQYKMLDVRREAHLKGESKSYTWEQVKQNARNSAK